MHAGARLADGRYEVVRVLGEGGMGVVFEVLDLEAGENVALKMLHAHGRDPQLIKREFRVAADVVHPNLVQLYDLFDDGDRLCMTMELVPGIDLLGGRSAGTVTLGDTVEMGAGRALDAAVVRERFVHVARGLHALHRRGVVHRDVKPNNVRVTPHGRVVVLDFGLAAPAGSPGFAGTPLYMAPEQGVGDEVHPPADWYAFGVMLYEALVGTPPWSGSPADVMRAKRTGTPPVAGDSDLAKLASDLMATEPGERPDGLAVLERLGQRRRPRGAPIGDKPRELIGRERELGQLAAALGTTAWIALVGTSGIGKTALLDALVEQATGAVLRGRCHEREAVAYKGIDQIVDSLVARLSSRGAVCPEVAELVHAFPQTRELAPRGMTEVAAAKIGHDRRGAALRALVTRLAAVEPVLVVLDDTQWADADCLMLLARAFSPPGIARVTVVVASRTDVELPFPFARMRLGALPEPDAIALAQALLGRGALTIDARAIAARSGGHPLDLIEHVRGAFADHGGASPAELLVLRVAAAPPDVRAIVELVVTAGAPIPQVAIVRAAGLPDDNARAAIAGAQLAGLVRARRSGPRAMLEPAHDRVREVLAPALPEPIRIARAAALAPLVEPSLAVELYLVAGDRDAARRCAEVAAEQMTALGGHDAAAALWRRAGELGGSASSLRNEAESLARAGRGSEAAERFDRLARLVPDDALSLRRRAAEQLLRAGRIREGLALIDRSLGTHEVGPLVAMARGLALHAATRAGRLPAAGSAPGELELVDLRWAQIAGNTLGSPGHFTLAVEHYLRAALRTGDRERISLAWSCEATLALFMGSAKFAERCMARAAETADTYRARGTLVANAGLARLSEGAWQRADTLAMEAQAAIDLSDAELTWERNTLAMIVGFARWFRGDLTGITRFARRERDRVAARGDLYGHELVHVGFLVAADVIAGDLDAASARLDELDARPTGVMTAWLRGIAHVTLALAGARFDHHYRRAGALFAELLALPVLRNRLLRASLAWSRAALELRAASLGRAWNRTLVTRAAAQLDALRIRGAAGLAALVRANLSVLDGDEPTPTAAMLLAADDMPGFAAAVRALAEPALRPGWRDALAQQGAIDPGRVARLLCPALEL